MVTAGSVVTAGSIWSVITKRLLAGGRPRVVHPPGDPWGAYRGGQRATLGVGEFQDGQDVGGGAQAIPQLEVQQRRQVQPKPAERGELPVLADLAPAQADKALA